MGVPREAIVAALEAFAGVPNRLEEVATVDGVLFVNDSKATNPRLGGQGASSRSPGACTPSWAAASRAAASRPCASRSAERCAAAYLIGEAAPRLASDLQGTVELHECATLERAVARAAEAARPGEVVLLSPACASFDAFADYEARGRRFRELVADLG